MIGAVLAIKSKGCRGVRGTTIGADGAGEYAYMIEGEPEAAEAWAREHVKTMERGGHRIESAILVRGDLDTYSGPALHHVTPAQQPGHIAESREPGARPLDEWNEGVGAVTWWRFPVEEAAWIGTPLDSDWPGYHTHWTPHPAVPQYE